ncbi:ATP-binding protein [Sphingomonas sanxanigenens]|uniref:histidine kinase n=1 Tax=Sphingomonas sanxanigenens DSM 19645 = NX02 TaxID=1123269 RepID=W0AI86_9SPHN|nr:ATP-binding protein [Sphingomonas sanxanigenens]AHE56272.1 hypothetical protein NX02_23280 [Sphingomonas sanxanigenens DSM 19645 = NX02]
MSLAANLTMRLGAIMIVGFVLLQLGIVASLGYPDGGEAGRPYSLPRPSQLAAIVEAIEVQPPARRTQMIEAFDGALYTVRLAGAAPPPRRAAVGTALQRLGNGYRMQLGRPVRLDARRGPLGRWFGDRSGPGRLLALVRVTVALRGGGWLVIESRPSAGMRTYLRRRSILATAGGIVLILILLLAVRQTARPISRVAAGVRGFAAGHDTPDLPELGPRDVRELARAFNEMKGRIAGLMAERTRMLAAIAHDLRTYLTRLRLRAEFIDDEAQRRRAITDIGEMAMLVDDTMLFAALDSEHGGGADADEPMRRAPVDLLAAVVRLVAARREMGQTVMLSTPVDQRPADERLVVRAPPLALDRIFDNLVGNALRHGSQAEVRIEQAGRFARLIVADDGPGVPADQLERLAEPFHRLDPSRDRGAGAGAGLGLAIVRALTVQMGGTLHFGRAAIGGLAVEVRLPLA